MMNQNADQIMSRAHHLIILLVVAIVFACKLSFQQCNPNDIKPFPRVLGDLTYPTTSTQMDTN